MPPVDQSKRAFFRGRMSGRSAVIRPPWSVADFEDVCNQCGDCIKACEENILKKGDGGFPEIDFSISGCELCEDCASACKANALDLLRSSPWEIRVSLKTKCLAMRGIVCRSCSDACSYSAIVFRHQVGGTAMPQISDDLCNGCGFCYSVCPEQAIEFKEVS